MTDKKQENQNGGTGYLAEVLTVNNETHIHNGNMPRNKSIIAEVVNIVSTFSQPETINFNSDALPAEVKEKIRHNNVTRCRYIIETYKRNTIDLNNVYNTLEQERPGRKQKLLQIVNNCYKQQLCLLSENENVDIATIQQHSDTILENITKSLRKRVLESSNLKADNEDVDIAVNLIVADAFMECLVLENPEEAE